MRSILAAFLVLSALVAPASAEPPDVQSLVKRMKDALEPASGGARRLSFTVSSDQGSSQITVGEARKKMNGVPRILLVAMAPEGVRGAAYLVQGDGPGQDTQWFYLPYLRRVRKVVSPEAYSAFLNTDFTYADLGFVSTGAAYTLVGEGTQAGIKTYQIQAVPKETWYYSRWVTTISAETGMPMVREIYDAANELWKRERWDHVSVIDKVALPTDISMEDVQAKSRTDVRVTGADFDAQLPDSLFEPDRLPTVGAAPIWATISD